MKDKDIIARLERRHTARSAMRFVAALVAAISFGSSVYCLTEGIDTGSLAATVIEAGTAAVWLYFIAFASHEAKSPRQSRLAELGGNLCWTIVIWCLLYKADADSGALYWVAVGLAVVMTVFDVLAYINHRTLCKLETLLDGVAEKAFDEAFDEFIEERVAEKLKQREGKGGGNG